MKKRNNKQQMPETEFTQCEETDNLVPEQEVKKEESVDFESKYQEANERFLRTLADLDNYRKRSQRDIENIRNLTRADTIGEFLTVFDHFQMAMEHAGQNADMNSIRQGMQMIFDEFGRTFDNLGVVKIDAVGKEFDPQLHEAIAQEASDEVPEGSIIRQWKCGFRLGERLLRPAVVVVSSGSESE